MMAWCYFGRRAAWVAGTRPLRLLISRLSRKYLENAPYIYLHLRKRCRNLRRLIPPFWPELLDSKGLRAVGLRSLNLGVRKIGRSLSKKSCTSAQFRQPNSTSTGKYGHSIEPF